jgi:hypothetical protein
MRIFTQYILLVLCLGLCQCLAAELNTVEGYQTEHIAGFNVRFSQQLLNNPTIARKVEAALREDLGRINRVVPRPALRGVLRHTVIWLELRAAPTDGIKSTRGARFHPSKKWLVEHGMHAEKAGGIEISNATDYLNWRSHQTIIQHEMAHAYHHAIGHQNKNIRHAWQAAKDAGLYQQVGYVNLKPGKTKPAYALNNHKEYFAELSEAYFGHNDYFPFTRRELKNYDPSGYQLVRSLWHMSKEDIQKLRK